MNDLTGMADNERIERGDVAERCLRRLLGCWSPSSTDAEGNDVWSWWKDDAMNYPDCTHEPMTAGEAMLMAELEKEFGDAR